MAAFTAATTASIWYRFRIVGRVGRGGERTDEQQELAGEPRRQRQPDQAEQEHRHRGGGDRVRLAEPARSSIASTGRSGVLRYRITANAPTVIRP